MLKNCVFKLKALSANDEDVTLSLEKGCTLNCA